MSRFTHVALVVSIVAAFSGSGSEAQPVFRGDEIFPPEEFAARRAKLIAHIGDGVAIVLGTTEPPGELPFRQNSQFFYLTGVAEPRASVLIDGGTKQTTVFLQPKNERRDTSVFGPALAPGARGRTAWRRCRAAGRGIQRPRSPPSPQRGARSIRRLPPKCSAVSRRVIRRGCGPRTGRSLGRS